MSMPFKTIFCDRCDLQVSSLNTAGRFVWRSGGAEFGFDRHLALCHGCHGVTVMEVFPDSAVFAQAQRRRAVLWRHLLRRYGTDEAGRLAKDKGFKVLDQVMQLQRRPVCLSCASDRVAPLRLPVGDDTDETARPVGRIHPGCGGQLLYRGSGLLRVSRRPVTLVFDVHGHRVT